jgi:hypothetical protein
MQKICPIYALGEMIGKEINHADYDEENTRCDGRMCAWYSEANKCCAVVGMRRRERDTHEAGEA